MPPRTLLDVGPVNTLHQGLAVNKAKRAQEMSHVVRLNPTSPSLAKPVATVNVLANNVEMEDVPCFPTQHAGLVRTDKNVTRLQECASKLPNVTHAFRANVALQINNLLKCVQMVPPVVIAEKPAAIANMNALPNATAPLADTVDALATITTVELARSVPNV